MFDNFNFQKYKTIKHPADLSLKTLSEIKDLQATPLNKAFALKYDNVYNVFKNVFINKKRKFPSKIVSNLLTESTKPILKIKNYHNRKRPNVMAKEYGINLAHVDLSSAKTPSFPSGHSAQAYLVKEVLSKMFPELTSQFQKAADNISNSRILAHVHYESDKKVGEQLGLDLYNHLKNI
jgi:hypothetical protein